VIPDEPPALIRVVIVDDQAMIRVGLRMMLDAEPDITVVGDARDGREAVNTAALLRPNVVLMDIRMPVLNGVDATREIIAAGSADAVVIITTFDDEDYLLDSVRAGASGFLLKDAGPDLLAAAVRTSLRGDTLIDPAMTRSLLTHRLRSEEVSAESLRHGHSTELTDQRERLATLTARELEVLSAMARGASNAEISDELYLSMATVKTHISSILQKTRTKSRVEAAVFAYETGFVRPGWLGRS
jgi:DNA-binding NarL/FixJ family response regulator